MSEAEIIVGDVLAVLASMEPESVSCVVTSPPYWSLRKYEAPDVIWGGEPGCEHEWAQDVSALARSDGGYSSEKRWQHAAVSRTETPEAWGGTFETGNTCSRCGAWRGQFGLEPTPELYVEHTLAVLRAIRRVLRLDGVVFWNIGDGYASNPAKGGSSAGGKEEAWLGADAERGRSYREWPTPNLKPKDLILMPERVALAAQADGWWVRSRIAWCKNNAMPESTRDRPTSAWEHIYMLTKSARYWWDGEAVRETATYGRREWSDVEANLASATTAHDTRRNHGVRASATVSGSDPSAGRNLRNVWEFPTAQTPEAHFATFPEELPRRCILAACPPEICAKCGTARVRQVETQAIPTRQRLNPTPRPDTGLTPADSFRAEGIATQTTGRTSCDCPEPDYQPGLVLDPFAGIGTTGIVARRLGRRFIGIELSEKYAAMAREKISMYWRNVNLSEPDVPEGQGILSLE